MNENLRSAPDIARLERLTRTELSRGGRLAHVTLLLVASAMTVVVVSLWLTEPALPLRTSMAFGVLTMIGAGWAIYSGWALNTRHVMLGRQRVIAARLAVTFVAAFTACAGILSLVSTTAAARPALAMGLVMLAIASALWKRADVNYRALVATRAELARQLPGARS